VLFWVSGSPQVGFGHLRRSWTLAQALKHQGAEVLFFVTSAQAAAVLRPSGLRVRVARTTRAFIATLRAASEKSNVQCVVDDPAAGTTFFKRLMEVAPVWCVDDTAKRFFPVTAVVNGTAAIEKAEFRLLPQTRLFAGSRYILLRQAFAARKRRRFDGPVKRVLILSGGGSSRGLVRMTLPVVRTLLREAMIDVVAGPMSDISGFSGIKMVQVYRSPKQMDKLMRKADIAISAGGQTLYELAAVQTPTIGVRVASNQRLNLKGLSQAGALIDAGSVATRSFSNRLVRALRQLSGSAVHRQKLAKNARRMVDGRGALRLAQAMRAAAHG